eukprot:CAMPEP_0198730350 /NCGR_PEP_ID=MMETSP1475-20131203/24171_1 /TAXON_ID= ORGANISM="Unidentified sp., Strain CCMP1999" /NCGR_SAMPLE_ID=MMETSP1475 /ASSEMBLY_ACC=CAM_ASM_001111 /LENGTH=97 /DNA_ID=CAMNT_0044493143 /DNA_START=267 /DNA_END=557 /DNA_ORIENTATION=+
MTEATRKGRQAVPDGAPVVGAPRAHASQRNLGLERWEQLRREWNSPTVDKVPTRAERSRARRWRSRELFDVLMEGSEVTFPQRVPLEQLVDTLINVW